MDHIHEKESNPKLLQHKEKEHQNDLDGNEGITIAPPIFQLKAKEVEKEKEEKTETATPQTSYDFSPSGPPSQKKETNEEEGEQEVQIKKSPYQLQSEGEDAEKPDGMKPGLAYSQHKFGTSKNNVLPDDLKQKSEETFDSDFSDISILGGTPPKVIWIRTGNITTEKIKSILVDQAEQIKHFISSEESKEIGCLEITD